jgi:hypothetical protein
VFVDDALCVAMTSSGAAVVFVFVAPYFVRMVLSILMIILLVFRIWGNPPSRLWSQGFSDL